MDEIRDLSYDFEIEILELSLWSMGNLESSGYIFTEVIAERGGTRSD